MLEGKDFMNTLICCIYTAYSLSQGASKSICEQGLIAHYITENEPKGKRDVGKLADTKCSRGWKSDIIKAWLCAKMLSSSANQVWLTKLWVRKKGDT